MADGIEVEILLDLRLFDGRRRKLGVSFFPYFSSSFGLFCLLSKKVSGNLFVVFLPVGLIIKGLVVGLTTIGSVSPTTLVTRLGLVVNRVTGGTTLDGVIDRGICVCQVWRGVNHEL